MENIKFLEKNKENFDKLNLFIDENKNNISKIIASAEIAPYLSLSEFCEVDENNNEFMKYKGIMVIVDVYMPAKIINFVFKDKGFKFNVPCICGVLR